MNKISSWTWNSILDNVINNENNQHPNRNRETVGKRNQQKRRQLTNKTRQITKNLNKDKTDYDTNLQDKTNNNERLINIERLLDRDRLRDKDKLRDKDRLTDTDKGQDIFINRDNVDTNDRFSDYNNNFILTAKTTQVTCSTFRNSSQDLKEINFSIQTQNERNRNLLPGLNELLLQKEISKQKRFNKSTSWLFQLVTYIFLFLSFIHQAEALCQRLPDQYIRGENVVTFPPQVPEGSQPTCFVLSVEMSSSIAEKFPSGQHKHVKFKVYKDESTTTTSTTSTTSTTTTTTTTSTTTTTTSTTTTTTSTTTTTTTTTTKTTTIKKKSTTTTTTTTITTTKETSAKSTKSPDNDNDADTVKTTSIDIPNLIPIDGGDIVKPEPLKDESTSSTESSTSSTKHHLKTGTTLKQIQEESSSTNAIGNQNSLGSAVGIDTGDIEEILTTWKNDKDSTVTAEIHIKTTPLIIDNAQLSTKSSTISPSKTSASPNIKNKESTTSVIISDEQSITKTSDSSIINEESTTKILTLSLIKDKESTTKTSSSSSLNNDKYLTTKFIPSITNGEELTTKILTSSLINEEKGTSASSLINHEKSTTQSSTSSNIINEELITKTSASSQINNEKISTKISEGLIVTNKESTKKTPTISSEDLSTTDVSSGINNKDHLASIINNEDLFTKTAQLPTEINEELSSEEPTLSVNDKNLSTKTSTTSSINNEALRTTGSISSVNSNDEMSIKSSASTSSIINNDKITTKNTRYTNNQTPQTNPPNVENGISSHSSNILITQANTIGKSISTQISHGISTTFSSNNEESKPNRISSKHPSTLSMIKIESSSQKTTLSMGNSETTVQTNDNDPTNISSIDNGKPTLFTKFIENYHDLALGSTVKSTKLPENIEDTTNVDNDESTKFIHINEESTLVPTENPLNPDQQNQSTTSVNNDDSGQDTQDNQNENSINSVKENQDSDFANNDDETSHIGQHIQKPTLATKEESGTSTVASQESLSSKVSENVNSEGTTKAATSSNLKETISLSPENIEDQTVTHEELTTKSNYDKEGIYVDTMTDSIDIKNVDNDIETRQTTSIRPVRPSTSIRSPTSTTTSTSSTTTTSCVCPSSTSVSTEGTSTSIGTSTPTGCVCPGDQIKTSTLSEIETATGSPINNGRRRRRKQADDLDLYVDDFDQKMLKKLPFFKSYP